MPSSAGKALEGQPKPKDPKDPFPPKLPPENVRAGFSADDKKEDKKDDKPKVETGFMTRTNQALGREYWNLHNMAIAFWLLLGRLRPRTSLA